MTALMEKGAVLPSLHSEREPSLSSQPILREEVASTIAPTDKEIRRGEWLLAMMVGLFFVWLVTLTVCFPWPLFDPDESLYAVIAREMTQGNEWLVPTYDGKPFLDRPAPYFWGLALSSQLFGETEFAYRLPNLLLGFGTVIVTGILAGRLFNRFIGYTTALSLMTMTSIIAMSLTVGHDTSLLFFAMTSILIWHVGTSPPIQDRWWTRGLTIVVLAASLAAGILSKGLLGVVLPAIGIGSLSYFSDRRRGFMEGAVAMFMACAMASCWYLAVEQASPGYLKYFFFDRHVLGFFTSTQRHGNQSRFVYVATLLAGGAPWVFLLAAPLWQFVRDAKRWNHLWNNPCAPLAVWGTAVFLLFFTARSANPTYLLPIFPPLAIGTGFWIARWLKTGMTGYRWMDGVLREMPVVIVLLTCLTIPAVLLWFQRPWIFPVLACGIVLTATTFARLFWTARIARRLLLRHLHYRVAHLGIVVVLLGAISTFVVVETLPDVARERSTKSVIEIVRRLPGAKTADIVWFNGDPPSAKYYGPDLDIRPIYFRDMQVRPERRTILITRLSRKEEVQSAPFSKAARWIDTNGRYRIMLSENF
ncbi:glycosyltransferase family 39 protein [bacterium]|nr:glycosyltransferase family 39 protein [bacterium]